MGFSRVENGVWRLETKAKTKAEAKAKSKAKASGLKT